MIEFIVGFIVGALIGWSRPVFVETVVNKVKGFFAK